VQTTKLISLVIPIVLSGCISAPVVLTGIGAASVATNEATGRTIADNTVSAVSGQDCRISRAFRDQAVCQDQNIVEFKITNTTTRPSTVEEIQARYR
jgi:hypothetical protein